MSAGKEILRFELQRIRTSPVFWLAALIYLALALAALWRVAHATHESMIILPASPFRVIGLLASLALLTLPIMAALVTDAVVRDFRLNTAQLLFVKPLRPGEYLFGRILPPLLAVAALMTIVAACSALAVPVASPGSGPLQTPHPATSVLWALAVIALPNLLLFAAMLAFLAVTTRSATKTYVGFFVALIVWAWLCGLVHDFGLRNIAALMDVFGIRSLELQVRTWTIQQRNSLLPAMTTTLMLNRAIWLLTAGALLLASLRMFRLTLDSRDTSRVQADATPASAAQTVRPAAADVQHGKLSTLRVLIAQTRFECSSLARSSVAYVLVALGPLATGWAVIDYFIGLEAATSPVTSLVVPLIVGGPLAASLVFAIVVLAGELAWRERDANIESLILSLPLPDWMRPVAKALALFAAGALSLAFALLIVGALQMIMGVPDPQPMAALGLIWLLPVATLAAACVALHVIANQKFLGHILCALLIIVVPMLLRMAGAEHNLLLFARGPAPTYSAFDGYAQSLRGFLWFHGYWALVAALLFFCALALRGRLADFDSRAPRRRIGDALRSPHARIVCYVLAGVAVTGGWIGYNTTLVNSYTTLSRERDASVEYERKYSQQRSLALPTLIAVHARVDIFPESARAVIHGRYTVRNRHAQPLREIPLSIDRSAPLHRWQLNGASLQSEDPALGYRLYRLEQPLAPGASTELEFDLEFEQKGFTNSTAPSAIRSNGTFVAGDEFFPKLGAAVDWIEFESIVSTSTDQVAVTSGVLQSEWIKDGRRFFHYKSATPMPPSFAYLSGRWQRTSRSAGGVEIEAYHLAAHSRNVERMIAVAETALPFYSQRFQSQPPAQLRIVEVPAQYAAIRSFPGVISIAESGLFALDLNRAPTVDAVFRSLSQSLAQQWWRVFEPQPDRPGSAVFGEGLPRYWSLLLLENEYGDAEVQKHLSGRLQSYSTARSRLYSYELPLGQWARSSDVHESKSVLLFNRLRRQLGGDVLDRALRSLTLSMERNSSPATIEDVKAAIQREALPGKATLVTEIFDEVTLYDIHLSNIDSKRLEDGRYQTTLTYSSTRSAFNDGGRSTGAPADEIEFELLGTPADENKVLYRGKLPAGTTSGTVNVVLDQRPLKGWLDPHLEFIDLTPANNIMRVSAPPTE